MNIQSIPGFVRTSTGEKRLDVPESEASRIPVCKKLHVYVMMRRRRETPEQQAWRGLGPRGVQPPPFEEGRHWVMATASTTGGGGPRFAVFSPGDRMTWLPAARSRLDEAHPPRNEDRGARERQATGSRSFRVLMRESFSKADASNDPMDLSRNHPMVLLAEIPHSCQRSR